MNPFASILDATDYERAYRNAKGTLMMLVAHFAELEALCRKMRDEHDAEADWQQYDLWQRRANAAASMLRQSKNLKAQLWKESRQQTS